MAMGDLQDKGVCCEAPHLLVHAPHSASTDVEAPPPAPAAKRAATWVGWSRGCMRATWSMIRRHPWVFIAPLICLAALLTAGIVGVSAIADTIAKQRQDDARSEAQVRGVVIGEKMQRAVLPVQGLANYVRETPGYYWPVIEAGFNKTAQNYISLLRGSGLDERLVVELAPAAVIRTALPLAGNQAAIGHDLLNDTGQRPNVLQAIISQELFLAGPYMLRQGYEGAPVRMPVYADGNFSANDTFGIPNNVITNTSQPYNCDVCAAPRRLWGFVIAVLYWEAIRAASSLDSMTDSGYNYRLTRPPQGGEIGDYILAQSPSIVNQSMSDSVTVTFPALTNVWTLTVQRVNGWYPSWYWPLIAAVIVVAFVLSVLLGLVLGWNRRLMDTTRKLQLTSEKLIQERLKLDALIVRQFDLLRMFAGNGKTHDSAEPMSHMVVSVAGSHAADSTLYNSGELLGSRIAAVRSNIRQSSASKLAEGERIQLLELLGAGNFGKVYKGLWHGTLVAIKCLVLPSSMSRSTRAETMAVMEAAISSALNHPHLVQTFTYSIKPIRDSSLSDFNRRSSQKSDSDSPLESRNAEQLALGSRKSLHSGGLTDSSSDVHSFEVRLVLEFCDGGSLRDALDSAAFTTGSTGSNLNYGAVLETATDIAKGMRHLHANEVLHSDLKACNIMFKSDTSVRGFTAKVADFGLAIQLDQSKNQTHVSRVFQGTLTHMAPEVLLQGKISKAADAYSFGILLFELYTGQEPYSGIATALLGHHVAGLGKRPLFPFDTPKRYRDLAERCWLTNPDLRPTFEQILQELSDMSRDGPSPQALAYSVADAAKARSAQVLRQQRGRTADDIGSASFLDAESAGARLSQGPVAAAAVAPGVAIELVDVASLLTATSLRQTVPIALGAIPEEDHSQEVTLAAGRESLTSAAAAARLLEDEDDCSGQCGYLDHPEAGEGDVYLFEAGDDDNDDGSDADKSNDRLGRKA